MVILVGNYHRYLWITDLGVANGDELVTQSTDFTVHDKTLEVTALLANDFNHSFCGDSHVRSTQKGETRGLVAATRLNTDETVLNNVNTANAVTTGNGVGSQEELDRVGNSLLLAVLGVLQLHRETLVEVDDEVFRLVGSGERVGGQFPHISGGSGVGVLQDTGLVRAVGQVLVHTPWLGLGRGDGDTLLGGVVKQGVTASETVVEDGVTPRGNDLDVGFQGIESEFEANLVVTLTGATVRDSDGTFSLFQTNPLVCFAARHAGEKLTLAMSI